MLNVMALALRVLSVLRSVRTADYNSHRLDSHSAHKTVRKTQTKQFVMDTFDRLCFLLGIYKPGLRVTSEATRIRTSKHRGFISSGVVTCFESELHLN